MSKFCDLKTHRVRDLLQWAVEELRKHDVEKPRLDAEVLLAHAMNKDRLQLYLGLEEVVNEKSESYYRTLIKKRSAYMPVSYLTGHREFMSLDFMVNQSVLVPRPETEILVETVCRLGCPPFAGGIKRRCRVLELGTGSGAIAVSLAKYNPDWRILATDLSREALLVARENARLHGVMDRISFLQADLLSAFSSESEGQRAKSGEHRAKSKELRVKSTEEEVPTSGFRALSFMSYASCPFDWVVSNPPYIPTWDLACLPAEIGRYEPILALDGGADGLSMIRRIIAGAYMVLKPGGRLAIEIGYGQSRDVQKIADETGKYSDCSIVNDYAGIARVFCCCRRDEGSKV